MASLDSGGISALEIYQEQLQMVYRMAYTYLQNRSEAEKTAQESFARFMRSGVDLNDGAAVRGWLVRSVTHICLKKLNTPAYRLKDDPAPHEVDRTMRAIMELPGKYKTAVYLAFYEQLPLEEVSGLMGDDYGIVSSIVGDAQRRLTERLGEGFSAQSVAEAYDKVKIDPNSAVQIWKNILYMQNAIDAVIRSRAAAAAKDTPLSEEPPAPVESVQEQSSDTDVAPEAEGEEPAEAEPEAGYEFEWDRPAKAPETGADEAATEAEAEVPPEAEPELAEEDFAPEEELTYSEDEAEAETDAEDVTPRRARHVRERQKPRVKPAIIIAAAAVVLIAVIVGIILSKRGGSEANSSGSETLRTSSDISVAVVTQTPVSYEGPKKSVKKLENIQKAMQEWSDYKAAAKQEYIAANLPAFADFLAEDDYFDGTDVVENGDGTVSFIHWKYDEDWGNTTVSAITGQEEPTLTQKFDYEYSLTVEAEEAEGYEAYVTAFAADGSYGDYNASYGVGSESDAQKLEEIAAKYSLTLRKGEGTSRGFGEASDEELASALASTVGHGAIYTVTPEIDYFTYYDNGAFQCMAELRLEDGRRMYTLLCATPYTEMLDALSANGISVQNNDEMVTRDYTSADGTALTVSQNSDQAILYAYLDNCYVVVDMGINSWREAPAEDDTDEARAAKQETTLSLSDEVVNFTANCINFTNIGKET